jgi:hypothetical protein
VDDDSRQGDDYWLSTGQFLNATADIHISIGADKANSLVQVQQLSTRLSLSSTHASFNKPTANRQCVPVTC